MGYHRQTAKVDSNHPQIVKELRKCKGVTVRSVATIKNFLDIIVGYDGKNYLFEIKDPDKPPSARRLTDGEQKFMNEWTGQADLALTTQDILEKINYKHS